MDIKTTTSTRQNWDPDFRRRLLLAYEYRRAVCGFEVMLGSDLIALDANHICRHQVGGPDEETNGPALCVLHFNLFDLGAFTVSEGFVLVSDHVRAMSGFQENVPGLPRRDRPRPPELLLANRSRVSWPGPGARYSRAS